MSAEQGDVEATKRALEDPRTKAELLAALERAERERAEIAELVEGESFRAQKAERALGEMREALEWLAAQVANEDGIPHAVFPAFENARGVLTAQSESKGWKNSQPVFGKYAAYPAAIFPSEDTSDES